MYDETIVIKGEPASKANSRRLVTIKGRPAFIRSSKAISYADAFAMQCRQQLGVPPTPDDVRVDILIYYASRRPDLDDSIILDAMQGLVYVNDRQVKQRSVYWALDKSDPRSVIRIRSCDVTDIPEYLLVPK
jgi:Holliday junction resolvase RusA-like endonuclease